MTIHRRSRSQRRKKRRPGRGRRRSDDVGPTNSSGDRETTEEATGEQPGDDGPSAEETGGNAVENSEDTGNASSAKDQVEEGAVAGVSGTPRQNEDTEDADRKNPPPVPSTPLEAGVIASASWGDSADRLAGNMGQLPVFSSIASDSPVIDDNVEEVSGGCCGDERVDGYDENADVVDNTAGYSKEGVGAVGDETAGTATFGKQEHDDEGSGQRDMDDAKKAVIQTQTSEKGHFVSPCQGATGSPDPDMGGGDDESNEGEQTYGTQEPSPHVPLLSPSDRGTLVGDRSDSFVDGSQLASAPASPERSPSPPRRSRSLLSLPSFLPSLPRPPSLRSGSSAGAVANLCGATLGAGVLSLPFAFSRAGLALGACLLSLAAFGTVRSIDLLIKACDFTGADGFEALTLRLCGPRVVWLVEGCIFVFCFGTAIAYIVAVGDMLQQGVIGTMGDRLPSFVDREFVMALFWAAIMFPLSLSRRIDRLRYASIVGIGSVSFLVLAAVIHSVRDLAFAGTPAGGDTGDVRLWATSLRDVLRACPIMIFAFSCQVNVCAIYNDLGEGVGDDDERNDEPTSTAIQPSKASRMARVTRLGVLLCVSLYFLMGLFGYLDFGKFTQDNVLKNFCVHDTRDPLMIFAFICITVTVVMAFPLNVLPARATLEGVMRRRRALRAAEEGGEVGRDDEEDGIGLGEGAGDLAEPLLSHSASDSGGSGGDVIAVDDHGFGDIDDLDFEVVHAPAEDDCEGASDCPNTHPSQKSVSDLRHAFLTLLISGSALLTALVVPDISIVFGLMGGTASSLISFILPGTFTLMIMAEEERSDANGGDAAGDSGVDSSSRARSAEIHDAESKQWRRSEAWILIVGGAVIGVLSTAVTMHSIFYEEPVPSTCSGDDAI